MRLCQTHAARCNSNHIPHAFAHWVRRKGQPHGIRDSQRHTKHPVRCLGREHPGKREPLRKQLTTRLNAYGRRLGREGQGGRKGTKHRPRTQCVQQLLCDLANPRYFAHTQAPCKFHDGAAMERKHELAIRFEFVGTNLHNETGNRTQTRRRHHHHQPMARKRTRTPHRSTNTTTPSRASDSGHTPRCT